MKQKFKWVVRRDFRKIAYSRHCTKEAAERAAKRLNDKWGWNHLGSEATVHEEGNGQAVGEDSTLL